MDDMGINMTTIRVIIACPFWHFWAHPEASRHVSLTKSNGAMELCYWINTLVAESHWL